MKGSNNTVVTTRLSESKGNVTACHHGFHTNSTLLSFLYLTGSVSRQLIVSGRVNEFALPSLGLQEETKFLKCEVSKGRSLESKHAKFIVNLLQCHVTQICENVFNVTPQTS